MAQAEQNSKSNSGGEGSGSGSGSGSRSNEKMKQKKAPQRGLGVAQLEKMREEQQQKKNKVETTLQSLSPNDYILPSQNSMFRSSPNSIPFSDSLLGPNSIPFSNDQLNGAGAGAGAGAVHQGHNHHGNWPKMWKSDHQGFSLPSDVNLNLNLNYESNPSPFSRLSTFTQGPHQFRPSSSSSSLMNVSTGISPSPGSIYQIDWPSNQSLNGSKYTPLWPDKDKLQTGTSSSPALNYQIERPSSQSLDGRKYPTFWPDEEKVGMKRQYPFSMETPPAPNFHQKISQISRIDEPATSSNTSIFHSDPGIIREVSTRSIIPSQSTYREEVKENRVSMNEDFLRLGQPAGEYRQVSALMLGHQGQGLMFDFGCQQGSNEDSIQETRLRRSIRTNSFSFLPPAAQNTVDQQNAAMGNDCNGEVGENIDLTLKL